MKKTTLLKIVSSSEDRTERFLKMCVAECDENFQIFSPGDPVFSFRSEFLEHIEKNGINSLFEFSFSMDSIVGSSLHINDKIKLFVSHFRNLGPAEELVVTDPYIYEISSPYSLDLLKQMLMASGPEIKRITFIHSNIHVRFKNNLRNFISGIFSGIQIDEIPSGVFHDRFWINPKDKKGVLVGNSLNAVEKRKIFLMDYISKPDIEDILQEAVNLGYSPL